MRDEKEERKKQARSNMYMYSKMYRSIYMYMYFDINQCASFLSLRPPPTLTACYGIVNLPGGQWFCRKCESQERAARVVSLSPSHSVSVVEVVEE